ncbi:ATP-binding protein [Streptomyces poonensis]|uniref:ATP-binding protein n=1 Tax=Streptomyces poonensis TaxID=68255 RepID=UPI00357128EE
MSRNSDPALSNGGLVIEVSDESPCALPTFPGAPPADDVESGRGLFLVQALCSDISVECRERHKTVRALLEK